MSLNAIKWHLSLFSIFLFFSNFFLNSWRFIVFLVVVVGGPVYGCVVVVAAAIWIPVDGGVVGLSNIPLIQR